jgi:hypothetical protein
MRVFVRSLLFLLALTAIARGEERWDPAKTYVVMVGITEWKSNGKHEYEKFPKRGRVDVLLEKQLLDDGVPRENLVFLKDKAATAEAMRTEIAAVAKRAPAGSTFIFYFNGHGDRDWKTGRNYLVNYDLDPADMAKTGFAVAELSKLLEDNFRSGRVLLLGDSCYSGALADVVRHFAGNKKVRAASLSSVVGENMAWATNSYTEDLIKIFAGDGVLDRDHKGKVTLKDAASFLRDEMRFREDQPSEVARNADFEPDFVIRDVDPTKVLRTLEGPWQLRDFVDAKLDGHWYRAQIVDEKDGRYKIHFFSKNYEIRDEWLDKNEIRKPFVHDVAKGDAVSVRSTADWLKGKPTWFDGVVTAVRDGFARVRYTVLPDYKAEWVPSGLLHYGEDKSAPPRVVSKGLDRLIEERIIEGRDRAVRAGER